MHSSHVKIHSAIEFCTVLQRSLTSLYMIYDAYIYIYTMSIMLHVHATCEYDEVFRICSLFMIISLSYIR